MQRLIPIHEYYSKKFVIKTSESIWYLWTRDINVDHLLLDNHRIFAQKWKKYDFVIDDMEMSQSESRRFH